MNSVATATFSPFVPNAGKPRLTVNSGRQHRLLGGVHIQDFWNRNISPGERVVKRGSRCRVKGPPRFIWIEPVATKEERAILRPRYARRPSTPRDCRRPAAAAVRSVLPRPRPIPGAKIVGQLRIYVLARFAHRISPDLPAT